MKELKNLNEEERLSITLGCEPFYLRHKEPKELQGVYQHLCEYIDKKYRPSIWVFLCATVAPVKYGMTGSIFSLNKNDYSTVNNLLGKKGVKVSYVGCKHVLEILDNLGYITLYKGFYDAFDKVSVKSCFVINRKLKVLLENTNIKKVNPIIPVETLVELRNSNTDELITELSKLRGINDKRDLVKSYNKLLRTFDLRCKSYRVSAIYKRVFTDDLSSHGRWYSLGCLQTTKSKYREFITINGYKTTEIDIRQMHPRILMTLDGTSLPMSWEPYADITDVVGGEYKIARKLSKFAMMCIINAKNECSAKSAIWKAYSDDMKKEEGKRSFKGLTIRKGDLNSIVKKLKEHNSHISHWFNQERLWAILQHYDSEITAYIIERFVRLGKCILPWHDSYVVSHKDSKLLIDTMREAWEHILGTTDNFFYDIEF